MRKESIVGKHTDSTAAGAVGSTVSKFGMCGGGAAILALSLSITSLGGARGCLRGYPIDCSLQKKKMLRHLYNNDFFK